MHGSQIRIINNIGSKSERKVGDPHVRFNPALAKILKARELFCISRDSNFDGVCGAALLIHNYGLKTKNIIFTNYSEFGKLLNRIKGMKIKNSAIVFNDFGLSKTNFSHSKRATKFLKSRGNFVVWLDHHPWENAMANSITKATDFAVFGESRHYCASELTYLLLCKKDRIGKKLALLAHYSDFPTRSKYNALIARLSYAILYAGYSKTRKERLLSSIALSVSKMNFSSSDITNSYKNYIKDERSNMKALISNSYKLKAGKFLIGLAFGRHIQTNSACAAIRKALHSDIEIYVNTETGKCGVRSKDDADGSAIAVALGGGGHPQASGFSVDASKFRSGKDKEGFAAKIERISKGLYE
jgi:oligoribonuclease NrnB/cAMP/cGMP phosphodiesterase (DHH superfamily)